MSFIVFRPFVLCYLDKNLKMQSLAVIETRHHLFGSLHLCINWLNTSYFCCMVSSSFHTFISTNEHFQIFPDCKIGTLRKHLLVQFLISKMVASLERGLLKIKGPCTIHPIKPMYKTKNFYCESVN